MTKRELTALVLKLTGIYVLVRYLAYLPYVLSPLTLTHTEDAFPWLWALMATAPSLLHFAVCVLIVVKSEGVASRLVPRDGEISIAVTWSKEDVLTVAFCCLGLMLLVSVIPQLVQTATTFVLEARTERFGGFRYPISSWARLAGNLAQLAIGLALFLQAPGLATLWRRLQETRGEGTQEL